MEKAEKQFLTTDELAERWRKSKRTLENQRGKKQGPNYLNCLLYTSPSPRD